MPGRHLLQAKIWLTICPGGVLPMYGVTAWLLAGAGGGHGGSGAHPGRPPLPRDHPHCLHPPVFTACFTPQRDYMEQPVHCDWLMFSRALDCAYSDCACLKS